MDLPSIKNLIGVLDCLPSIVRKSWSSPWIAWKYVETNNADGSTQQGGGVMLKSNDTFSCPFFIDS